MRINHTYGKRFDSQDLFEPKRKYFIACEGRRSEYRYFNGLYQNSKELGISSMIELVFVEHDNNSGNHPLQVIKEAKNEIDERGNFLEGDSICIVVDRDANSFTVSQFETALKLCLEKNCKLYVSNPCFELWLLFHFSDLGGLDLDAIKENLKQGRRTYTESLLKERLGGSYSKRRLDFNKFKDRVSLAISNSRKHPTALPLLRDNVGSNIGLLISEMRQMQITH